MFWVKNKQKKIKREAKEKEMKEIERLQSLPKEETKPIEKEVDMAKKEEYDEEEFDEETEEEVEDEELVEEVKKVPEKKETKKETKAKEPTLPEVVEAVKGLTQAIVNLDQRFQSIEASFYRLRSI